MHIIRSFHNDIRNLRNHICPDWMLKAVFQYIIPVFRRQIIQHDTLKIKHILLDFLHSLLIIQHLTDLVPVPSRVDLQQKCLRWIIAIDHNQFPWREEDHIDMLNQHNPQGFKDDLNTYHDNNRENIHIIPWYHADKNICNRTTDYNRKPMWQTQIKHTHVA